MLVNTQLDILFGLKAIQKKGTKELEFLRTTVAEVLESLKALGGRVKHWDFFIVYFVCHRLDPETHEAWELSLGSSTEPPTYETLNTFLESLVRALETINARNPTSRLPIYSNLAPKHRTSARIHSASSSATSRPVLCTVCYQPHYISTCQQYKEKTAEERKAFIVSKKLCYNCLGAHVIKDCRVKGRCQICQRRHHTSLHVESSSPATSLASSSQGNLSMQQSVVAGPSCS